MQQKVRFIVNYEDFDDIALLMRTANLRPIEAIASEEPVAAAFWTFSRQIGSESFNIDA